MRSVAILCGTLAAGILLLAIYSPGLHGAFFFDDLPNILAVEAVRLTSLSPQALRDVWVSNGAGPLGRPVAQITFGLNQYFSGFDPFAFKLTNLAIHLVNGVLVFVLAICLFSSLMASSERKYASVAAGLLATVWLLHPIQVLPVLHVVQRMTSLSALFLLVALLCHMQGRGVGGRSGAIWMVLGWGIFWPLSLLSKETGVLFPVFVLAWELIVRRTGRGEIDRFAWLFAILFGGVLIFSIAYSLSPFGDWLWAGYGFRNFSLAERFLTEGRVLWFYLGLTLWPSLEAFGLFHDDFIVSAGILSPWTTLLAFVGLGVLVWLAWLARKRMPLVSFGIAWFLIGHLLESTFLPLELVHEHRNYLPGFGILLAVVSVLMQMLKKSGIRKTVGISLIAAMLAYFPFMTMLRADQFGDEVRRSQIEAQHHPGSARAQHEAGRVLAGLEGADSAISPRYSLAKVHYELAGQLDPNFKMNFLGLIHLNCQAGVPVERSWVVELRRRLRDTPFAPGDRTVLYGLKEMMIAGVLCLERSDVDSLFTAAIANSGLTQGVRAMLFSWYADYLWLHERDLAAAIAALSASLVLVPSSPSNRLKLAQLRLVSGEQAQVRQLLLGLRDESLSMQERKTLDELLVGLGMLGDEHSSEKPHQ